MIAGGLAWLLAGGRRRAGEKYAGLGLVRRLALRARVAENRQGAFPVTKKLVLAVIDAMKPAMLERAVSTLRTPTLAALIERGQIVDECVAAFPSVTPVCAASIATGAGPGEHEIPSMNWWHRGEERYIEYGTSFGASRAFGIRQSLTDTIYNMNLEHLSRDVSTVFERLDDAEVRTAGTTYLMYRGRFRHEPSVDTALSRLAHTQFGCPPGARASCSTPTCSPPARRSAARSWAFRACATSTPAAWPSTWWRTTCSTSCCCRCPTTTRTRTSTARSPRSTRWPPRTSRSPA